MAGGKPGEYSHLLTLSFAQIKLVEDALRHSSEAQEHRQFIRDEVRRAEKQGKVIGKVPRAINHDRDPTTWADLGVKDTNNKIEMMWALNNFVGEQGFDVRKAVDKAATKAGIGEVFYPADF